MKKIAILGAGSWGTALAMVLAENQHEARLWGNNEAQIKEINERHTNEHFLPGVFLLSAFCLIFFLVGFCLFLRLEVT